VKIISEPSVIRYTAFKVIRSNIEIPLTLPRIDRSRSNLVQSLRRHRRNIANVKVKGQRSKVKVK